MFLPTFIKYYNKNSAKRIDILDHLPPMTDIQYLCKLFIENTIKYIFAWKTHSVKILKNSKKNV